MYWNTQEVVFVHNQNSWLITFDVLKLRFNNVDLGKTFWLINNIWCIEITFVKELKEKDGCWLITFDVLKLLTTYPI